MVKKRGGAKTKNEKEGEEEEAEPYGTPANNAFFATTETKKKQTKNDNNGKIIRYKYGVLWQCKDFESEKNHDFEIPNFCRKIMNPKGSHIELIHYDIDEIWSID